VTIITVLGHPAPQGSKSFKGIHGGKAILTESSKAVRPWRQAVTWCVREQAAGVKFSGPVTLEIAFTMKKPKKPKYAWPAVPPDLSKLIRSTEDALTDSGIWEDDARVVRVEASKLYQGQNGALDVPGATIMIRKAGEFRAMKGAA
jgi:Holliday junction resolvase RusA-like endonuclease